MPGSVDNVCGQRVRPESERERVLDGRVLRERQRKVDEAWRERAGCEHVPMASETDDRPERTNVLRHGGPRRKVVCQYFLAGNASIFVLGEMDEAKVQGQIASTL